MARTGLARQDHVTLSGTRNISASVGWEPRARQKGTDVTTGRSDRGGSGLATAVHELRTPLATVLGFLETLVQRGDELDPRLREQITRIACRNAQVLQHRIDALLAHELDTGDPDLRLVPRRLRDVVARIVEDCAGVLGDHAIHLDVDPDLWAAVDPDALSHVVANLLVNAARHSAARSAITIRATGAGDDVRLEVVDDGDGIAPADLPHVFEEFFRGGDGSGEGTGLGLSVVKRYVTAWGGQVEIESTLGHGTRVRFSLPAVAAGGTSAEHAVGAIG